MFKNYLAASKILSGKIDTYSIPWRLESSEISSLVSMWSSESLVRVMLGTLQSSSSKIGVVIMIEGITCILCKFGTLGTECKLCCKFILWIKFKFKLISQFQY